MVAAVTWLLLALACRKPAPPDAPMQPEAATGCRAELEAVPSDGAMVVSAHPEASRIGAEVLAAGGSAADAAAAVAVALTLVEPQSSGLGGGAFLLHYDAETKRVSAWDGRETAPAAATPALFHGAAGPRPWHEVVPGGLSVGTPGLVRLLEAVHAEHGALEWARLLEPTAALAERGFTVTPRTATSIRQMEQMPMDSLRRSPSARAYFYPDGAPLDAGSTLKNPELAATVRAIAEGGAAAFYTGPIAEHIVAAVREASVNPGRLSLEDLASYRAVEREPVCLETRGRTVCGHPPPTSGGTTVLQILGLLEPLPLEGLEPGSAGSLHLFAEAARLAWADRDRYLADPDFEPVPVEALVAPGYLADRAAALSIDARLEAVEAGALPLPEAPVPPACPEGEDTTHLVVVDHAGDVVTLTSSIEMAWGSGLMVDGFLLNNQLTDFSGGVNGVAACKRPRSSMAPILVLDADGEVEIAIGSPGGSRIIQYTARALVHVLDQGLDVQQAISRPNVVQAGSLEIEDDCGTPAIEPATIAALEALGHSVKSTSLNSGLHGIQRSGEGWLGGVDPRREGVAIAVPSP